MIVSVEDHATEMWTCGNCGHHDRINAKEYFEILFDQGVFTELDPKMESIDPLKFKDTKPYNDRLKAGQKKSGLKDAITTGYGEMNGHQVVIACMNFNFIGGSMGSVVGEKIARAMDRSLATGAPFIMISKSGGARMMKLLFRLCKWQKQQLKSPYWTIKKFHTYLS